MSTADVLPNARPGAALVPAPKDPELRRLANCIRLLAIDAVERAKSGHPGMPMGMADIAAVLYRDFVKFDAADPHWIDRDRFLLSNGHGSMLLYALLYLTGVEDMTLDELKRFRQVGSKTPGHPEYKHSDGIETSTGPLGQGIANAVGLALGESILSAEFGPELVDHYTYVFAGDGCLMEEHQPRGDLACRAPEAWQADPVLRQQLRFHRRRDLARRIGRPIRSLPRLRLARAGDRRP